MVRITHRYDALGGCRKERPFTTEQERTYRLDRFAPTFAEIYPRTVLGAAFFKTLPYIVELRAKSGEGKTGELETCFNALYGVLLLRLQKKEIQSDTLKAIQQISTFLSILAEKYKQEKAGELELE